MAPCEELCVGDAFISVTVRSARAQRSTVADHEGGQVNDEYTSWCSVRRQV